MINKKPLTRRLTVSLFVVGVARLELAASWSRTKHATSCATPRNSFIIIITHLCIVK